MGFFSAECTSCHHPLLSTYATNEINSWMTQAVAIHQSGSVIVGEYDGYGRIDDHEYAIEGATVYHRACWIVAGQPREFLGESEHAQDQGYFFEDPAHDMVEPTPAVPRVDGKPLREAVADLIAEALRPRQAQFGAYHDEVPTNPTVTAADLRAAVIADTERESRLEAALRIIEREGRGGCENSTAGIGACFTNGRTANAYYGADRACAPCTAHYALTGQDLPLGKDAPEDGDDA